MTDPFLLIRFLDAFAFLALFRVRVKRTIAPWRNNLFPTPEKSSLSVVRSGGKQALGTSSSQSSSMMVVKFGSIGSGEEETISPGSDMLSPNSSHEATEMASTEEAGVRRAEPARLTLRWRTSLGAAIGKEVNPASLIQELDIEIDKDLDEFVLEPEPIRELALEREPRNDSISRLHRSVVRPLGTKTFALGRGRPRALERFANGTAGTVSRCEAIPGGTRVALGSNATNRLSFGLLAEGGGFGAWPEVITVGACEK